MSIDIKHGIETDIAAVLHVVFNQHNVLNGFKCCLLQSGEIFMNCSSCALQSLGGKDQNAKRRGNEIHVSQADKWGKWVLCLK